MKYRKFLLFFFLFFVVAGVLSAQKQVIDYFTEINESYKGVNDYKAEIAITTSGVKEKGLMWVKGASVKITINNPRQIICINDGKLIVYDSSNNVVLEQEMSSNLNAGTIEGLQLLRRHYKFSYHDEAGYKLVPLETGSNERVVKLNFSARSSSLEFRKMLISFSKDNMIRRIEGTTFLGSRVVLDFLRIQKNIGISSKMFNYEPPGVGHTISDFIFTPE